jgi:hypothetical protein
MGIVWAAIKFFTTSATFYDFYFKTSVINQFVASFQPKCGVYLRYEARHEHEVYTPDNTFYWYEEYVDHDYEEDI